MNTQPISADELAALLLDRAIVDWLEVRPELRLRIVANQLPASTEPGSRGNFRATIRQVMAAEPHVS